MDYKRFLASLFTAVKREHKYSYQQFAEDLGFARTNIMYQYIKGVRKLSTKSAEQICNALSLGSDGKRYFLLMTTYCNSSQHAKREEALEKMLKIKSTRLDSELDRNQLTFLSEWFHPVILELVDQKDFVEDIEWIAGEITPRLRPEQIKRSLRLIEDLGLVTRHDGKLQTTKLSLKTGHRIQGIAVNTYHQKMMEKSLDSLTNIPGKLRNISALTVSINHSKYHEIRALIHEFNERIYALAEDSENANEIYQMNIQLFPFRSNPTED